MMEAMAGDHLNGKQIMREGDKEVSFSCEPRLYVFASTVCRLYIVS